jgi:hypothetical protein
MEFRVSGIVTARFRHDRDAVAHEWAKVREEMVRGLQKHYGALFPEAMTRIDEWIETEEPWMPGRYREGDYLGQRWDLWPESDRPTILRLDVLVR